MDVKERLEIAEKVFGECKKVLDAKGKDYGSLKAKNVNSNFEIIGEFFKSRGIDKYDVWAVYFMKHIISIIQWVNTRRLESEPIDGRIVDAINYLVILKSMLVEDEKKDDE